ncbi:hypothetical protein AB0O34_03510 [Sphaerisporangium sp. NPDC088356]|uniref:hypothetical protein n=1 Tax=Sphaerisporangium sp. NPDC088356 TaxID=3154871 RepID=UPI003421A880
MVKGNVATYVGAAAGPSADLVVTAHRIGEIGTSVVREKGQQVLVLKPDAVWPADPATVYPVTIDPTTTLSVTSDTTLGSRSDCASFDTPKATL